MTGFRTGLSRGGRPALLVAMVVAGVVAGCASDRPKPTPLAPLVPRIAGEAVWNQRVDSGAAASVFRSASGTVLLPVVRADRVFAASPAGAVAEFQADSGAVVWRATVGAPIAAGVGSDGRHTAVVTRNNEVVVLEQGREVWRKRLPSSVVTPPLVAGERVFVMSVDRVVHAFDALDGRRLWLLQRPGDALTLAQPGVLTAVRNVLVVGQGPRLVGVDALRGSVLWEVPMATPRGTNEVERLADLVGPVARVGDRVCARAFQSAVACADPARGALVWSRSVGGLNAVGADADRVYGADASDRIAAWRLDTGDIAWTNEQFLYRGLSGALAVGPMVVFGDSQGQVHFLASDTGEPQLRLPTDGTAIVAAPVLVGGTLIVATQGGGLYAFRPSRFVPPS